VDHDVIDPPGPRTSLVGREAELEVITAALRVSRLVTVTGLGGAGKTRLALEVARRHAAANAETVRLVGLAPAGSVEGVVAALLAVFGTPVRPSTDPDPLRRVVAAAPARNLLLVLDTCEPALDEIASVVDRLLEERPQLRFLATSREPLRLPGESVLAIDPLPVLPSGLRRPSAAVRLFVERARAARHDFAADASTHDAIVTVCRLVDGIPLAIELAAAHVGHLSIEEIGRRLRERPDSLVSRDRTIAARHRTMTAALDWSYELLDPTGQLVLRRLSLFSDGAPVEGIAAVCELPPELAGDAIAGLVDTHLVLAEQRDGSSHYRLLETVRRYALERLQAADEVASARRHQAVWLTQRWRVGGADRVGSSAGVGGSYELGDLSSTLSWAVSAGEATLAHRLAAASWAAWEASGRHAEGRSVLTAVLDCGDRTPDAEASRVRIAVAQLAFLAGDLPAARRDYQRAIDDLRRLDAGPELAAALQSLAMVLLFEGDDVVARSLASEAIERYEALGDEGGAAFAHTSLAMVEAHGRRADAAEWHFLEAVRRFRRLGLKREAASVLDNLGNLAADLGQPGRAHRFYEGALQLQEQIGDDRGAALSLNCLCLVAQRRGNLDRAWEHATAARQLFHRIGDRAGEAATVNNLANLASERGQAPQAMELYGECIGAFRDLGDARRLATALQNLADLAQRGDERQLAWDCMIDATQLWHQLGERGEVDEGIARLRTTATGWRMAEVDHLAAQTTDAAPDPDGIARLLETLRWVAIPVAASRATMPGPGLLTARERQVTGLVAEGLSNAQIATELFISERTVESHVSNARTKLGIDSRTRLTRWALEHGVVDRALGAKVAADGSRRPPKRP
jgi:predicted ATPase/DNA-binding CsgD family transcriptional regulator